jgi:hypothetical protein
MPSEPSRLIRFNKPYGILSQFTPEGRWRGLKDFIDIPDVYVAGRLDADSEGLLLLTNDGQLQARIADPRFKMEKTRSPRCARACNSTTASRALPARVCSIRRPMCGRGNRPFASARAFRPHGWNWRSAKAATARCGA